MKRSFIAISVATIIGLSACATKVSSSTSMNSPISTSVTSEQEFLSNLENASTSQILQKLKEWWVYRRLLFGVDKSSYQIPSRHTVCVEI